jgi:hypothetical protein
VIKVVFNIFTRIKSTEAIFLGTKTSVVNKNLGIVREVVNKSKTLAVIKPLYTSNVTGRGTVDRNVLRSAHCIYLTITYIYGFFLYPLLNC